ncbi:MAG: cytochrome c maturation protein CcmE [Sandaracinaceae bacterium]
MLDEEELAEEIRRQDVAPAAPAEEPASASAPRGRGLPAWVKLGFVFVILGVGVVSLLFGTEAFTYSKLVDEVMASPRDHVGRNLRVEGQLVEGSLERQSDPCEHRFVLFKGEHRMPVRFPRCVVPDTFRDNGMVLDVVVEGELQDDGSFLATQIIPRCPSKYEMEQRQGEMPPSVRSST